MKGEKFMRNLEWLTAFYSTTKNIIPITVFLILFQVFFLKRPIGNTKNFVVGIICTAVGLHLFLRGIYLSLMPLGENIGRGLLNIDHKWMIVFFGFVLGYAATIAEPALRTVAFGIEEISAGSIRSNMLIQFVAFGFASGMAIGILKVMGNISNAKIIAPLLVIIVILMYFAPDNFLGIALDAASAAAGPVNIPISMTLAVGIASAVSGSDPLANGFGIVALTSLGTITSVLSLGVLSRL